MRSLRPLALLSLAIGILVSMPGCFFLPAYWMPGGFSSTYRSHLRRQVTREDEELDQKIRQLEEPAVVEETDSWSFGNIGSPFRSAPPSDSAAVDQPPTEPPPSELPPIESGTESPEIHDVPVPKPDPAAAVAPK